MNLTHESHLLDIAKTIMAQIKYGDPYALPAWGARHFVALPESKEFQGGLRFRVSGLRFQGLVQIELRWADDYTITFIDDAGMACKVVESVYCDMLVGVIDWVEGR